MLCPSSDQQDAEEEAMATAIGQVATVCSVDEATARRLLSEVGGDVERAVQTFLDSP